jgi:Nuclease-related domain
VQPDAVVAAAPVASATPTAVPAPTAPVPAPEVEWEDLALRVPGQGVRETAKESLAAMKERSRVGTFIARALDLNTDERSWRVGADGEETVGSKLNKLSQHGWHVLHSVPVGERGSDIDHVLIGPGGVFTINTKLHPGKKVVVYEKAIYVDGFKQDYLRNSRFEATRATKYLTREVGIEVPVRPVIIILTAMLASLVEIKHQPDGVTVLTGREVPKAFTRIKPILTQDEVTAIYEHARRSTTWTKSR